MIYIVIAKQASLSLIFLAYIKSHLALPCYHGNEENGRKACSGLYETEISTSTEKPNYVKISVGNEGRH